MRGFDHYFAERGKPEKNLLEGGRDTGDGGRARRVVCRAGAAWYC